ncbi:MAG: thioredoxin domain-containing protein [Acidobacteriota bacterium]|nr:thioredoxin domain-containing protein [Acidobacteriota bacterium]
MKTATTLLFTLLFFVTSGVLAQTPRRRTGTRPTAARPAGQPATQPTPAPTATSTPTPQAPVLLAVVNGQNVTTADLEPSVREEVESLASRIADARQQILELEINTLLLDVEAKKRRVTPQQLYDSEVKKKIVDPTPAEIAKLIEDSRGQLDGDPATIRQQVIEYLRSESERKISGEFVKRLRSTNAVVKGADLSTPNLAPSTILATVAGRPILAGAVNERLKPIMYKLRLQAYLLEQPALDQTVNNLLLIAEANRLNVAPEEIVRKEISEKVHQQQPTEAEVSKFYSDGKSRINGELNSVRGYIVNYLVDQNRQRLEREFSEKLRKGANVRILLSEPEAPVQTISADDDPARGDTNAPVTLVEFTDFQCPSCAAMHPVIEEALKSYGNKVRLVVRDFPLPMHANARKAAEAANAAHFQGKFFEYAALLFKHQNALDVASLKKYATELGLNRTIFDVALDSGKYAAEVRHDINDGEVYGVDSTPTIFVNGVALTVLSADGLRAAIDRALAATQTPAR